MQHCHYTGGSTSTDYASGQVMTTGTWDGGDGVFAEAGDVKAGWAGTKGSSDSQRHIKFHHDHSHSWGGWSGDACSKANHSSTSLVHNHSFTTNNTGGSTAHENMPPYVVKFCWERTA